MRAPFGKSPISTKSKRNAATKSIVTIRQIAALSILNFSFEKSTISRIRMARKHTQLR